MVVFSFFHYLDFYCYYLIPSALKTQTDTGANSVDTDKMAVSPRTTSLPLCFVYFLFIFFIFILFIFFFFLLFFFTKNLIGNNGHVQCQTTNESISRIQALKRWLTLDVRL